MISYCLSVPDWVYSGARGQPRWLIREAMGELLPDAVRENTRRGVQAADLGHRLVQSAAEVTEALHRLERSSLAPCYLALDRMRQAWERRRGLP